MASDIEAALREVGNSLVAYVKDAATMTVESRYVHVTLDQDADFEQSKALARTIIRLDGDSEMVFPLRQGDDGYLEADNPLFGLHQQNVSTAIEYRARMIDALLSAVPQEFRGRR
jgi:hypothetical protein